MTRFFSYRLFLLLSAVLMLTAVSHAQPGDVGNKVMLAQQFEQLNQLEKAKTIYVDLYKTNPSDYMFLESVVRVCNRLKQYEESIGYLNTWNGKFPGDINGINLLGKTHFASDADAGGAIDASLKHGDRVDFGPEHVRVIATPGHTPGSLSYLWRDRVFTGDSLMIGGCGCTEHPAADPARLYDSVMRRLFTLPGETLVFPHHDRCGRTVSTIAEERETNPAFAQRSRDEFITRRRASART